VDLSDNQFLKRTLFHVVNTSGILNNYKQDIIGRNIDADRLLLADRRLLMCHADM
jgi:hypothetical protein